MRVLIVGLGGGGCRLLDTLYAHDRRFGSINCLSGIAVDGDADTLNGLANVPNEQRIYYMPLYPGNQDESPSHPPVEEIVAKLESLDSGDIDAIIICSALGGDIPDIVPELVPAIKRSMVEPVFGLYILPCARDGAPRAAKAYEQVVAHKPLLEGIILFDNETWLHRIQEQLDAPEEAPDYLHILTSDYKQLLSRKQPEPVDRRKKAYNIINDLIARRIGLILRAGEFNERGSMEIAEVVLDAGEVLNTIRGMGFITIGYAMTPIEKSQFDLINRLAPGTPSVEEDHKKASRVVDIAKRAIYEENSTPCDLGTAAKALILIAGPSHEMSMKGFMTVRRWIDKSIRGLEVRSGDYPVHSSGYLAIIIILAGVEEIPRLDELKAYFEQSQEVHESGKEIPGEDTKILPES
ncbi:MAG: hypothetical protein KO173_04025 [Methanoregulaceae archaeon]|jgi:cell division GTPase FtsZ|nr:hypothetical protein [Methanoregulaceae archaeon]MDD5047825.1 hypothetical protein [Methanoregulaceae archaeon]